MLALLPVPPALLPTLQLALLPALVLQLEPLLLVLLLLLHQLPQPCLPLVRALLLPLPLPLPALLQAAEAGSTAAPP